MEIKALSLEEEAELEALKQSPYVALARKEQRIKYRRKQILYTLRGYEKRGKVLAEMGITSRALEELDRDTDCIEWMVERSEKNAQN